MAATMKTIGFLKQITGEGYHCLFALKGKKIIQEFYEDLQDLVDHAEELDSNQYDTYFSLGTFKTNASRTADNVAEMKSFFLDIDVGESKAALGAGYETKQDAVKALAKFCKQKQLPKPIIIDSGGGIHVYWPLDTALPVDEWAPVAKGFKSTCVQHGLAIDLNVPADAARILRVPNTHNYKEAPRPVTLLSTDVNIVTLDYMTEQVGRVERKADTNEPNAVAKALFENQESSFQKILRKTEKGTGCEQLRIIITDQATMEEPLWRAGLSIAKHCVDGDKAVRIISQDHPGYDPEETEDKYTRIKGPYTCATFDGLNPSVCPDCPNWGKIKSPIQLGKQLKEALPDEAECVFDVEDGYSADGIPDNVIHIDHARPHYKIPSYPAPYVRGRKGGIYLRTADADGESLEELIYHHDFYVTKRVHDPEFGESIVLRLHLPRDGIREFTISLAAVTSKEDLRKKLAIQGITVARPERVMQYLITWVNQLQADTMAEPAHKQFGWVDDKMDKFVLGNRVITPHGEEANAPTPQTEQYFELFEPKGTLEDWKEAISFWDRDGFELYQFVLCAGFGSVLMPFSNVSAATLHLHSESSGVAKTTAMYSAIGIFGNPKLLTQKKADTDSSRMNRGEIWKNLPFTFDEITNIGAEEASDLLYALTDGQQKNRMRGSDNQERYRGKPWNLLAISTGNRSIMELIRLKKVAPKAEAQRLLECYVPNIGHLLPSTTVTLQFEDRILNTYGVAATPYIRYIMEHRAEVEQLCKDLQEQVDKDAMLVQENRFWSNYISKTIAGAIIAKRAGLISFDVAKIYDWALNVLLPQNKSLSMDIDVDYKDIMNDFFSENINNILRIKSTADSRNGGNAELGAGVRNKLVARYEYDVDRFYIYPKALREFCVPLQINFNDLVKQLKRQCGAAMERKRMAKGTNLTLPTARVLALHFKFEDDDEDI